MRIVSAVLVALLVGILGFGCSNSAVGPAQQALTLPSESTMMIPSFLGANPGQGKIAADIQNPALVSWVAVTYWTVGVNLALAQPRTAFIAVRVLGKAAPITNGWTWTLTNADTTVVLTGIVDGDSVRWSMVANSPSLQNYTYFTGASTLDAHSGNWIFYDTTKVANQYPAVAKVSYNVTSASIATAKVEIIKQADANYGAHLEWEVNGDARAFEAHDAVKDETVLITWSALTEAGSIENITTGDKGCWDTKVNSHATIACQ